MGMKKTIMKKKIKGTIRFHWPTYKVQIRMGHQMPDESEPEIWWGTHWRSTWTL